VETFKIMKKILKIIAWLIGISMILYVGFVIFGFFAYTRLQSEVIGANDEPNSKYINNGDIIFQTSKSSQSKAIQLATKSQVQPYGNHLRK